ncbi:MAG: hypothetical protein ACRDD2_05985 [Sarcina sp.]
MKIVDVLLREKDLKVIAKGLLGEDNFNIKEIKFQKENQLINLKVSIKKLFSVDLNVTLRIISVNGDRINSEIEKITSLKIDLFSKVQRVIEGRNLTRFRNKGIIINGKEIIIEGNKVFKSLDIGEIYLNSIKVTEQGILLNANSENEDKLLKLKAIG